MKSLTHVAAICAAFSFPHFVTAQAREVPIDGPFVAAFVAAEAARNAYWTGDLEAAYGVTKPLAEAGNPVAENLLGVLLSDPEFSGYDVIQALAWYEKAATQGFGKAMYNLAQLHFESHPEKPVDRDAAMAAYAQGITANYLPSVMDVLHESYFGADWIRDKARGNALLSQAVALEPDDPQVQFYQGEAAYYGFNGEVDEAVAFGFYSQAAAAGNREGLFAMARALSFGSGVAVDEDAANEAFAEAAAQDHAEANGYLARSYYNGYAGEVNIAGAFAYAQAGAALEDPVALAILGAIYQNGDVGDPDYTAARSYFTRSYDAGRVEALNFLADMAYYGQGEPVNYEKFYAIVSQAADEGETRLARYNMGYAEMFGQGTAQNLPAALRSYELALNAGNVNAYADLPALLAHPDFAGPHQDPILAYAYCGIAQDTLDIYAAPDFYDTSVFACDLLRDTLTDAQKADAAVLAEGL